MEGAAAGSTSDDTNGDDSPGTRKLTNSHLNQITVLRSLSPFSVPGGKAVATKAGGNRTGGSNSKGSSASEPRQFQINEISQLSGLNDEKEVQRYLFILEGQKLVSPYPEGDFTSKTWQITRTGIRALKTIDTADC